MTLIPSHCGALGNDLAGGIVKGAQGATEKITIPILTSHRNVAAWPS